MTTSTPAAQPSPAGRNQPDPAHAFVALVARSLDFYRELGCEVRLVADGWVQLRHDDIVFVLEQTATRVPAAPVPFVRIGSDDLHSMRKRLLARGISSRGVASGRGPAREFEVIDPDGHHVIVWESLKRG